MRSRFPMLLLTLPLTLLLAPRPSFGRPLTFEERVRAQDAIERTYYSGQIGATMSFEAAVPPDLLERKVHAYLEKSAALETLWKTPITATMLRRELERMVEQTQMPDRLRELFAALGDDPFLIQECLARPALVDRLARNFFAYDESIHQVPRQETEGIRQALLEGRLDARAAHPRRTVEVFDRRAEPEAFERLRARVKGDLEGGSIDEERDAFLLRVPLERSDDSLRIATYRVEKETWDAWWARTRGRFSRLPVAAVAGDGDAAAAAAIASPAIQAPAGCNTAWDGGLLDEIPDRAAPSVWAGSAMLVWGGSSKDNKGWRYDPVTDTWSPMSRLNAPAGRFAHTLVWTGSQVIVWGGYSGASALIDGGRYDPVSDTWSAMSTAGAPSGFFNPGHKAVWTGTRMIVWGTINQPFGGVAWSGGLYDPSTNAWSPMSTANAPTTRGSFTATWAGGRLIVWGGANTSGPLNSGGRYDPVSNTWSPMTTTNAPVGRRDHSAVSSGPEMLVWGGSSSWSARWLDTGGRYDPTTDTWTPTSTTNAPGAREGHGAVWTGSEMVVWGGIGLGASNPGGYLDSGGRYNPVSDTWTPTSTTNAPAPRAQGLNPLLWTGNQVLVWGGGDGGSLFSGGRFRPATDSWTPISTGSAPDARDSHTAVWTGSQMVVWGGKRTQDSSGNSTVLLTGGRYDPALATWSPTSTVNAPTARYDHTALWTGQHMIVWGGNGAGEWIASGGRYDPLADSWAATSMLNAPLPRLGHSAVWTGHRMVVWGGKTPAGFTNTGGRYDPVTDHWMATATANAPLPRFEHTGVWTGSRMLIWGGGYNESSVSGDGGRYDPEADTWLPIAASGAPSARRFQSAAWTGQRMMIWGGVSGTSALNSGACYDPATNTWSPMIAFTPSCLASAVWTGDRVLIWGGYQGSPFVSSLDTGGAYDPGFDTWSAMSTADSPTARGQHTAVWTGEWMIVWGGIGATSPSVASWEFNTGARYCACGGGTVATYYQDADGDGFGDPAMAVPSCAPPVGSVTNSGDCDDTRAAAHPGGVETCNGLDDDCNGTVDEGMTVDNDGDGFSCSADCDDFAPAVHPGAAEICDQRDDNCDGVLPPDERDDDGDHFAGCQGDCRDDLAAVHPGAPEGCDGIDTDCDGLVPPSELDADGDGFPPCIGDCDDGNPARHPGATETCNGVDDDCDGSVDEGTPDTDGDGHVDCSDCQPSDPETWAAPPEVTNLQVVFDQGSETCLWDDLAPVSGLTVLYDVFAGSLASLRQSGGLTGGFCLQSGLSFWAFDLSVFDPGPPGNGLYIMVRGHNPCGVGTYGSAHRDQTAAASPLACP
ncbi:MAG TPA: MopE-related protein [Candidatus Polarisedimenticolia bacterium]|nr:MopE-related protein [Candidatus Polarisedimenticolia bacterium]